MKNISCCFFGHRTICESNEIRNKLYKVIENLIVKHRVKIFLFGSKSRFDELCLEIVSELKQSYPHIRRIYVRAEYPNIDKDYTDYLLLKYDDTYFPQRILCASRAVYVERNQEMIDNSKFCVCYYNWSETSISQSDGNKRKSGTEIAFKYAKRKKRKIINLYRIE